MSKAIIRTATSKVVTFIRDDVPAGWCPPPGCHVVEEAALAVGWQYDEPQGPVPAALTAAQLRLWLLSHDLLELVTTAIAGLPPEQRAAYEIMWEYETTFTRDNPQMLAIAEAIGMSAQDVDRAFREGALL